MVESMANVPCTEAALGCAGGHTLVVDRPDGKAGGMGLGFNGAKLLGLAIGGCYCNDLRYVAHELGIDVGEIVVTVRVERRLAIGRHERRVIRKMRVVG